MYKPIGLGHTGYQVEEFRTEGEIIIRDFLRSNLEINEDCNRIFQTLLCMYTRMSHLAASKDKKNNRNILVVVYYLIYNNK